MFVTKELINRIESLEKVIKPEIRFNMFSLEPKYESAKIKELEYKLNRLMSYLGVEEVEYSAKTKIQKTKKGK